MDTHTNGLDQIMRASRPDRPSQSRLLAKLLKKYKKKAGITLAQLASGSKIPMGTIAGMFTGKLPKHEEPLRALAVLLGGGDALVQALRADRHARGLKPAKVQEQEAPTPEAFLKALHRDDDPIQAVKDFGASARRFVETVGPMLSEEILQQPKSEGPPMRQAVLLSEVIEKQAKVAEIQKQTDLSKADAEKVLTRRVPDEKRPGLFTLDDLHALLEQLPEGESLSVKREALKLEGGAALFTIWKRP